MNTSLTIQDTRWESPDRQKLITSLLHNRKSRCKDLTVFGPQYSAARMEGRRGGSAQQCPQIPGAPDQAWSPSSTWPSIGERLAETFVNVLKKDGVPEHYGPGNPPVFINNATSVQFVLPHPDNNGG